MTSSKPNNNWDDVMESVNKASPADHHEAETPGNTPTDSNASNTTAPRKIRIWTPSPIL